MKKIKNKLIILFLVIISSISFAEEISNNVIDNNAVNNIKQENGIESHRHSVVVNLGNTIFYMLEAPTLVNLLLPSNDPYNPKLQGTFGLDLTYTYRASEKIDVNFDAGLYTMKTYYNNANATYNGDVYGLGFSIGGRFYFNKKDRASGFFIMPKVGTTLFITKGNEYKNDGSIVNRDTYIWDFYASGEFGFRIDISRGLGVDKGVRPFLDISIMDVGYSYNYIFRFVLLPRFAIGILF